MWIWPVRRVGSMVFVFCTKFGSNICYSHWDRRIYTSDLHLMTPREFTSGFDFWSRDHLLHRFRWLLLPRDTQTPGHRWLHYGSTWQSLASAKTQSLHQAQNIHLSCAVGSVIRFWNVDNAQSRQWQDPVFSHAGTASYPWYQMVWQGTQRSSQW